MNQKRGGYGAAAPAGEETGLDWLDARPSNWHLGGASHLPVCPVSGSAQRAQSGVGAGLRLRPDRPPSPSGC